MIDEIMLYTGSAVITLWGIAHMVPTKSIVMGFGAISTQNRRIITMEWVGEGLTLCFVGLLVLSITILTGPEILAAKIIYRAAALMLVVLAALSTATGARTSIVPMKICPFVKTGCAILFFLGSVL